MRSGGSRLASGKRGPHRGLPYVAPSPTWLTIHADARLRRRPFHDDSVRVSDGGGAECWEWVALPINCSLRLANDKPETVLLDVRFGFVAADEDTLLAAHQRFVPRHPS